MVAVCMLVMTGVMPVAADTTTDLSGLKVYAVTADGEKSEVKMAFNPTTYNYDITIKSTAQKIEIVATPADSTSTAVVEKDGINTVMDTGINKTTVLVTSQAGATNRYTLNTTKVAPAHDNEVDYASTQTKSKTKKASKKSAAIKVGKKTFKISSFSKGDIPKGFEKTKAKYKGKSYDAIKGEVKDLTAFYLTGSEPEGFYIYDKDQDKFYKMNNLKVKSRMLTVVKPAKTDSILKNYSKDKIDILGKKVDVWTMDEEEGMYFVYCMNWDGKTRLYTYDKEEEVLQRYLIDNDVNSKIEAANNAYNNIKERHNKMVGKYNVFRYVILGMAILVIFLVILLLYIIFSKKEKKIVKDNPELKDAGKNLTKEEKKAAKLAEKEAKAKAKQEAKDAKEAEKLAAKEAKEAEKLAAKEAKEQEKLEKAAAKNAPAEFDPDDIDAPQLDDEIETEDDVILDVSDDKELKEPVADENDQIELDLDSISEQDDIQDTLKSMLDDDSEDDDDDFEFIDLN